MVHVLWNEISDSTVFFDVHLDHALDRLIPGHFEVATRYISGLILHETRRFCLKQAFSGNSMAELGYTECQPAERSFFA